MWARLFASNQAKWSKSKTLGSRLFTNYSSGKSYTFTQKMYPMILALPLPMIFERENGVNDSNAESPSQNNEGHVPKGTNLMSKIAISTAIAGLVGISGYAAKNYCQGEHNTHNELETWLKTHKLIEILSILNNHNVNELSDLKALESQNDIEEFVTGLGLHIITRNKLKKALTVLIDNDQATSTAVLTNTPDTNADPGDAQINDEIITLDTEPSASQPITSNSDLQGYLRVPQLDEIDVSVKHRSIMMIGQTGSGKSTLLNSMVNYLWNVQYDDKYRYKLVYEKKISQSKSQTEDVTAYYLKPPILNYQLTVIDTPGFGDTRGLDRDQEITRNIKTFFEHKIQDIDAICFVIRAPQARLSSTQKYIFHQVLSIFGADIKENIFVLLTFADDKKPPALAALKSDNVPYEKYFKLNNCAFGLDEPTDSDSDNDSDNDHEDYGFDFGKGYWHMGIKSFEKLFQALDGAQTKSLMLTKQVLTRREQLEAYIENIQPTINQGYAVLEGIRKQIYEVNKYSDLIDANKNFEIEVSVTKAKKHKTRNYTTTCIQCNYTCHNDCGIVDDKRKDGCVAMDNNGNCKVCKGKCAWKMHMNLPYVYEYYTVKEKKTIYDLKKKYYDAKDHHKSISQQMVDGLENKLSKLNEVLDESINGVRECINELCEIALRPNVLSQDDYIDKIIQSEELQKKTGWQHRCQSLRVLQEKREMIREISSEEYKPWKKYEDVEQYAKENLGKGTKMDKYWFMSSDQF
eukprot:205803_1